MQWYFILLYMGLSSWVALRLTSSMVEASEKFIIKASDASASAAGSAFGQRVDWRVGLEAVNLWFGSHTNREALSFLPSLLFFSGCFLGFLRKFRHTKKDAHG